MKLGWNGVIIVVISNFIMCIGMLCYGYIAIRNDRKQSIC